MMANMYTVDHMQIPTRDLSVNNVASDGSLEFFAKLQPYLENFVSDQQGNFNRFVAASIISRLIFLRFLDDASFFGTEGFLFDLIGRKLTGLHSDKDLLVQVLFEQVFSKPQTERRRLPSPLTDFSKLPYLSGELFQFSIGDALSINSISLCSFVQELLPNFCWSLSRDACQNANTPKVSPWILSYIHERLIENRETGSYFTPDPMARSIVLHAMEEWILLRAENEGNKNSIAKVLECWHRRDSDSANQLRNDLRWLAATLANARLIDLSVGGGAFLVAASELIFDLAMFCQPDLAKSVDRKALIQRIFEQNIFGLDIQGESLFIAKMRLWLLALELDALTSDNLSSLPPLPNFLATDGLAPLSSRADGQISLLDDGHHEALCSFLFSEGGFDLCVGNPPFIALSQDNQVPSKTYFIEDWNNRNSRYAVRTTSDLSNFFILRGIEILRSNGVLAYITSRNFFDTRYGEPIRRFLMEEIELRHIFTLHAHPFVQSGLKVKANTVILSLARRPPVENPRFHHLMSWREQLSDEVGREVSRTKLRSSQNWTQALFEQSLQEELRAKCKSSLAKFATARMGIKTGCNTFFLRREDSSVFKEFIGSSNNWSKIVKNSRDIRGYTFPSRPSHRILNLHERAENVEKGYKANPQLDPISKYIFEQGIVYSCAECQALAVRQHEKKPELYPHSGMCVKCLDCRTQREKCDRPVDRLSTAGHHPEWYTLPC